MDALRGLPSESDTTKWLHRFNFVLNRKDTWDDLQSLERWLRKQRPWKTWDKRVLDLYLVSLPFDASISFVGRYWYLGQEYAYTKIEHDGRPLIVPHCTNRLEVGCYTIQDHSEALANFTTFCSKVPVHVIFSERSEVMWVSISSSESILFNDISQLLG